MCENILGQMSSPLSHQFSTQELINGCMVINLEQEKTGSRRKLEARKNLNRERLGALHSYTWSIAFILDRTQIYSPVGFSDGVVGKFHEN